MSIQTELSVAFLPITLTRVPRYVCMMYLSVLHRSDLQRAHPVKPIVSMGNVDPPVLLIWSPNVHVRANLH